VDVVSTNSQANLRQQLRSARRNLTAREQRLAARGVARQVGRSRYFRSGNRIACYFAADGEIATDAVIEQIWQTGKKCYMPILTYLTGERLWFAPVTRDSKFVINRFGILEPVARSRSLIDARELDLVLMPLVGFDIHGNRIGMGGGFYDRTLAFLHHRSRWHRPRLMGLAHELQQTEALSPNSWDVPLDAVATDQKFILFDRNRS
jgi:5-formyltetrahydrofolate cyclo-ligase